MKTSLQYLLVATTFLSSQAMAVTPHDFDGLASAIRRVKDASAHPTGTAVAVVKNGKVVYEGYFGYADIDAKVPIDRNTSFYIASTTKPFLALNTLLAESGGKLDTRTSMQAMIPAARFNGFDASALTVKNLLTHTSGVDNPSLVWATAFSGIHNADSRLRLVGNSYPNDKAPLGTFKYTNVGYNIASVWLEQTLATPWQDQLAASIFAPLGMTRTTAYISQAEGNGWTLAKPYSFVAVNRNTPLYLRKTDATMHAAGGLLSTAPDLAKFLIAQLADGKLDGMQIFPASIISQSHDRQARTDSSYLDFKRDGYAWGWYTGEYKGKRMLHHFGAFAGFHAHLSFIPEANVGLVVLNNEDILSARLTNLIADYAYGIALDESDIEAKASTRFDGLVQDIKQLEKAAAQQHASINGRAWHLSLPRQAYAGRYTNALLGDMTVGLNGNDQLILRWGQLSAVATGYDKQDHVRVEFAPNSGEVVAFVVKDRKVEAIDVDGMTFEKAR
ncbi:serine hydrolase domain-containing protein [Lysobacter sp. CFH 32150]|uniref:serine hydrolase domain-containing protein n=1 Tax=Lysobacter sp. CFH 32150 TaxID=2927128 RepID=UPI001FA72592|nr:serine hydrolase domain-containing protein [Lysobacter sp. CFH 32150]MCI4566666.1 beta-lactamase family protein [Lysobacter sp. CFH 32150]